jgi:hypothetical protein
VHQDDGHAFYRRTAPSPRLRPAGSCPP